VPRTIAWPVGPLVAAVLLSGFGTAAGWLGDAELEADASLNKHDIAYKFALEHQERAGKAQLAKQAMGLRAWRQSHSQRRK